MEKKISFSFEFFSKHLCHLVLVHFLALCVLRGPTEVDIEDNIIENSVSKSVNKYGAAKHIRTLQVS